MGVLYLYMIEFIKRYKGYIAVYVFGFLTCLIVWLLNSNHKLKKEIIEIEKPVITVKTEVKTDTVTITKTIPKPEYITETVIRRDTIEKETIIPIVQRQYLTEINTDTVKGEITAVVSGYEATLDTLNYKLNIYPKSEIITIQEQITKYKQKKINFGIYGGVGYSVFTHKPDLQVGIGIVFTPF